MAEDVTLRLRMLDEFSATTGKMSSELKRVEGAAVGFKAQMSAAFESLSAGLKKVEDNIKTRMAGAFESLKQNWLAVSAAIAATMVVVNKAFESISKYANYAEIKEQLNLMAGQFSTTGDAIVASIKKVTGGQVSLQQATQTAADALKNSLTPEMITGLAQAAETFADVAGVSVANAFNALTDAVAKGNAKAIAAITGKEGLGDAMKVLESSATDAEKTMAVYNAVMAKNAAQAAITGKATFALANQLDTLSARLDDAKLKLGEQLTKAALYLTSVVLRLTAGFENLVGAMGMVGEAYARYIQRDAELADKIGQRTDEIFRMAEENKKLAKTFADAAGEIGKADVLIESNTKKLGAQAVALGVDAAAVDVANAKWKLIGGTWTQVNAEAATVATGLTQIKTAADSIPKNVNVKVTTTYVDVRTGAAPSGAENAVGTGPDGTSYGNWSGMFAEAR